MLPSVCSRSVRWFRTVLPVRNYVGTSRPTYETHPKEETTGVCSAVTSGLLSRSYCTVHTGWSRGHCTAHTDLRCWRCLQTLGEQLNFFCPHCRAVQPPDESASHFQMLGCTHSFTLDTQDLQRRYLQLQRSLHPDNFSQSTKEEQQYSEHQSALLNRAYSTLLKPLSRGLYMLELLGMPLEEGTDSGAGPAFLMEMMELNEEVEEARTTEQADRIGRDTKVRLKALTAQIDAALHKGEHQAAKMLLIQMRYLANIEEKVKEQLSKMM